MSLEVLLQAGCGAARVVLLTAVFYLAAIGSFTGSASLSHLSGYLLIADAALALYLSASTIVNATWGRTVLPAP